MGRKAGPVMMTQSSPRPRRPSRVPLFCALALPITCLLLAVGCESDSSMATTHPGDAALRDPMGYKVTDWPTVSGNGPGESGKKAFQRDLDGFLNP
jgi:hypothetical protein